MRTWIAAGLLFVAATTSANQVHYQELTLADGYGLTHSIVVVHDASPTNTRLVSTDVSTPTKKVPPFQYEETEHVVDEVLKGDATLKGKRLWVKPAGVEDDLFQHKLYYLEGISESPIYHRYRAAFKSVRSPKQRILFLSTDGKGSWKIAFRGGIEGFDAKEKILALKKRTP